MRKFVLLAGAVPLLLFAPTALAADEKPEKGSICRVPDVDIRYDSEIFTALAVLPVSGCESREDRMFTLAAKIVRHDPDGGRDVAEASTPCGPFPSAHGDESASGTCGLGVALDHPEMEEGVQYDVDVTYPAAADERTMRRFTFCTSDANHASCEH